MVIAVIILSLLLVTALAVAGIVISRQMALKSELATLTEREKAANERAALTETAANERIAHIENNASERIQQSENATAERIRQIENAAAERIRQVEDASAERIKQIENAAAERIKQAEASTGKEFERMLSDSEKHFRLIANEVLANSTDRLRQQSEQQLKDVLTPLRENIDSFRKKVEDTYNNEARERFSLQQSLREMMELNRSIGKEAKDLAEALRGNSKVQGDWGEMILETILEKSGLKRDVHYHVQLTTDENGNTLRDAAGHGLRPDVVVDFPDGRCIVIDSKVSLSAYVNMVNAGDSVEAQQHAKNHLASVKAHIKELSVKNYQDYIGNKSTDFVMMFIPNEGAYLAAMNLDPSLWQEAYDRRVIIISPTHLISAVRLIEQLWRQDDMKRNVIEIATESGKMYDKFVGFVDDLNKIGRGLESTQNAYDNAFKKLRSGTGNLITRAENLRKLGAKATKRLAVAPLDEETDSDTTEALPS
ncbi:MAG: DNA recombination protein RmuC [Barnesiella sp.]|nr:DNA recombination protein RmuC [Barnesiella sp.]